MRRLSPSSGPTDAADPLAEALFGLCAASASVLADMSNGLVSFQGLEEWYADPMDPKVFRRRLPAVPMLAMSARSDIESTPDWATAMEALLADPVLGHLMNRMVGTALGSGRIQAEGLLHSAIARTLVADNPSAEATRLLDEWRNELGADPVDVTTIVVVGGIEPTDPVHLGQDVTARQMTDDEVAGALRLGALPVMPGTGPLTWVHHRSCITIKHHLRRVVGDDIAEMAEAMSFYSSLDQRIETALATVRLLGFRHVREYARITQTGRGASQFGVRGSGLMLGPSEPLDGSSEARAREIFAAVADAIARRPQLAIALRRFSGSHEPRHEEDRLLDLWIAMEALFSPDETSEVTFRLALNTANWVDVPELLPRDLFDWIKRAYALRSDLVHGRSPALRKLTRLRGTEIKSISEAADDLREVVGIALLRFLFEAARPDFTQLALREAFLLEEADLGPVVPGGDAEAKGQR